jgi:aryl-alcohol dehydrogenase-like predicted oxidoreductase
MQGLLTGAYKTADHVPTYRARTRHFAGSRPKSRHGEAGHEALLFQTLARLQAVADEAGIPLSDLATVWPLENPTVHRTLHPTPARSAVFARLDFHAQVKTVIVGATKAKQLEANARAARREGLGTPEAWARVVASLNEATEELKAAMGPNADLWQGTHADGKQDGRIK